MANGEWALSPGAKADEIATTFSSKYVLAEEVAPNQFTEIKIAPGRQNQFLLPELEFAQQELSALNVNSGTGPDTLPARILKECAQELGLPITILAKRVLVPGSWPKCWRYHWISPLSKKKVHLRMRQTIEENSSHQVCKKTVEREEHF